MSSPFERDKHNKLPTVEQINKATKHIQPITECKQQLCEVNKIESVVEYFKQDGIATTKLDVCNVPPVTDASIYKDIVDSMPDINTKIQLFCRSTSQTSRRLLTPIMMNAGNTPLRTLRQLLAQIEDVKGKVTGYLSTEANMSSEFKADIEGLMVPSVDTTPSISAVINKYTKRQVSLFKQYPYLQSILRELYTLIQAYNEIKSNKSVPDDWDEEDFEKEEVKGNLGLAVRNAIRDFIQSGRVSGSTLELFEAHGVSPFEAVHTISEFFKASDGVPYTYEQYNQFIDDTVDLYANHYLKALDRLGLNSTYVTKSTASCK